MLFAGMHHYWRGGWIGYAGGFDTLRQAIAAARKRVDRLYVVDGETGKPLWP